jgi:hypothetical protein
MSALMPKDKIAANVTINNLTAFANPNEKIKLELTDKDDFEAETKELALLTTKSFILFIQAGATLLLNAK